MWCENIYFYRIRKLSPSRFSMIDADIHHHSLNFIAIPPHRHKLVVGFYTHELLLLKFYHIISFKVGI
jgi:hypothetical protein